MTDALPAMLSRFAPPSDWRADAAEVFATDRALVEVLMERADELPIEMLCQISRNQLGWAEFWSRHHPNLETRFFFACEAAAIKRLMAANAEAAERHLSKHYAEMGAA